MLAVRLWVAEKFLERSKPVDRAIGGGIHPLGPPLDQRRGVLFQGLESLKRDQLRIGVQGCPQDLLVKGCLGQYDFPIWPAFAPLGETLVNELKEIVERKNCVSIVSGLLEHRNTDRANPASVVVRYFVAVREQCGISFREKAVINGFQRDQIRVSCSKITLG